MIPVIRIYPLYLLQTVLITAGPGVHSKRHILFLKSKYLETQKHTVQQK